LMFGGWFKTTECDLLSIACRKIRDNLTGAKHMLGALTKRHSMNHHDGNYIGLMRVAETRMGGGAIAFLRILRLRPVIKSVVADPVYQQAKPPTALTQLLNNPAFWHAIYVIVRATFGALRLLRLCDTEKAAMDKLYYFTLKTQEGFRDPKRCEELNTAAWDASHETTEMYKWIHMYFCDEKKRVPFSDKQAPLEEQVSVLYDEESDSDSSDDEEDDEGNGGSDSDESKEVTEPPKKFFEKTLDILQCQTEIKYTLAQRFEWVFNQRCQQLMHPFSIAAWICSPVPQVQATWGRMDESDKRVVNALIVKFYGTHGLNEPQTRKESDEMISLFWDERDHFATRSGDFADGYKWTSSDILNNRSHFWHKKHSVHCTAIFGKFACVVTSKIIGIGSAERQWRDVKQLKQGQRTHLSAPAVRMQSTLYGDQCARVAAVRRDRIIATKGPSKKGMCVWEEEDMEACGLDAYGIDIKKEIEDTRPAVKRQFKC
jgi:hypothetical protein